MVDILTPSQIAQLRVIGVEYDHQIDQLTVAQMNEIGVGIGQIHQIQLSALNAKRSQQEETTMTTVAATIMPSEAVTPFTLNG